MPRWLQQRLESRVHACPSPHLPCPHHASSDLVAIRLLRQPPCPSHHRSMTCWRRCGGAPAGWRRPSWTSPPCWARSTRRRWASGRRQVGPPSASRVGPGISCTACVAQASRAACSGASGAAPRPVARPRHRGRRPSKGAPCSRTRGSLLRSGPLLWQRAPALGCQAAWGSTWGSTSLGLHLGQTLYSAVPLSRLPLQPFTLHPAPHPPHLPHTLLLGCSWGRG